MRKVYSIQKEQMHFTRSQGRLTLIICGMGALNHTLTKGVSVERKMFKSHLMPITLISIIRQNIYRKVVRRTSLNQFRNHCYSWASFASNWMETNWIVKGNNSNQKLRTKPLNVQKPNTVPLSHAIPIMPELSPILAWIRNPWSNWNS